MKLVASLTSPYARKIRVALAEKNLPFDPGSGHPLAARNQGAGLQPARQVPALVADDGEVWFDSPVIALYLETSADRR